MVSKNVNLTVDQPWLETHSLQLAINTLHTNSRVMMAYLPVLNNDAVKDFTRYLREEVETKWLPTHGKEASKRALSHVFGQSPQLITVEDTDDIDQGFKIGMTNNVGLLAPDGTQLDLSIPATLSEEGIVTRSLITQINGQKHIQPEFHRDQNVLTINFYAAGKGLIYRFKTAEGSVEKEFKSPCITIHRGASHKFGEACAIPHRGQSNRGNVAANLIWDMHTAPAAPSNDF